MKLIDIVTNKKIVIPIFLIGFMLAIISVGDVQTNYDMTKYLPEDSLSTTDLETIEANTSDISTISVMVKVDNKEEIEEIEDILSSINDVSLVIIDANDENNYKEGYALYTLIVENNTSDKTKEIRSNIEDFLEGEELYFGGESIKTVQLEDSITSELPIIVLIGFTIVFVILFFTTKTYLEPISILLVIGIAIVLNLGSNIIFEDISYVTKSTAAILQLGLSMDYTIIILHNYYKEKQTENNKDKAMKKAVEQSYRTVLSSSFTTIIGLLALVFMSFTIGTDLGLVLAKGIVFSLITSFTLLPVVLVLVDKVPFNKGHKTIGHKGFSVHFSKPTHNIVVSVFVLVLVIGAFFVQNQNTYLFTEPTKYDDTEKINSVFEETNTFIIAFDRSEEDSNNESIIIDSINQKYQSNLISYIGKSNTNLKDMNQESILEVLDEDEGTLLLGYYYASNNEIEITYHEFVVSLASLLEDYPEYQKEETELLLYLFAQKDVMFGDVGFYTELVEKDLIDENILFSEMISIFYDVTSINVNNVDKTVKLYEYIYALNDLSTQTGMTFETGDISALVTQTESLKTVEVLLNTPTTPQGFVGVMNQGLGIVIDEPTAIGLYTQYNILNSLPVDTLQTPNTIIEFMIGNGMLTPEQQTSYMTLVQSINMVNTEVTDQTVNQTLSQMITAVTEIPTTITTSEEMNLVIISQVLKQKELIPSITLSFTDTISGITQFMNQTPEIQALFTDQNMLTTLNDANTQLQLLEGTETYNILELETIIGEQDQNILIYGNYVKDNLDTPIHVSAEDLLTFVNTQDAYTVTSEQQGLVDKYLNQINVSKKLTTSDNLNVIILNTSIPLEGEDTKEFIDYMRQDVLKDIEVDTYLAGSSVSNMDIADYFEQDLLKINFITIGAIFVIIAFTFKSVLIPFLLVFTIEGAIWTNLSTSTIMDQPILFIVYIIIGAIQLGATIDYAILLTNSYLNNRKEYPVAIAMTNAMKESSNTILTSGLMLIVAGFTIYFTSTQASINTVGLFIGKGTIISIIYVLFLLPAILTTFDKWITRKRQAK